MSRENRKNTTAESIGSTERVDFFAAKINISNESIYVISLAMKDAVRFLLEKNDDSYCCLTTERSRMHPLNESTKMGSIPTNCRPTSIGPIFTRVSQGSTGSRSALIILFKFNLTWKSMKIQQKKMRSLSEELFYGILFSQNGIDRDRAR